MKVLALALLSLLTLQTWGSTNGLDAIYGEDDRVEVYQSTNPVLRDIASATAAQINNMHIAENEDGSYKLKYLYSLGQSKKVCATERFTQQPSVANCTGFLVSDDILVTAGHCLKQRYGDYCKQASWVFDFKMNEDESFNPNIPKENLYRCKKVITAVYDMPRVVNGNSVNYGRDFAVIQLDRPVEGRTPLTIRTGGTVKVGTPLAIIGNPSGLPTKIAEGASVKKNSEEHYFTTNLDSFHGNSGSPIINTETGVVEGILVRGKPDYLRIDYSNPQSCKILNHCDDNGKNCKVDDEFLDGEQVTRISEILQYL